MHIRRENYSYLADADAIEPFPLRREASHINGNSLARKARNRSRERFVQEIVGQMVVR